MKLLSSTWLFRSARGLAERLVAPDLASEVLSFIGQGRIRDERNEWRFALAFLSALVGCEETFRATLFEISRDPPDRSRFSRDYRARILGMTLLGYSGSTSEFDGLSDLLPFLPATHSMKWLRAVIEISGARSDDPKAVYQWVHQLGANEACRRRLLALAACESNRLGFPEMCRRIIPEVLRPADLQNRSDQAALQILIQHFKRRQSHQPSNRTKGCDLREACPLERLLIGPSQIERNSSETAYARRIASIVRSQGLISPEAAILEIAWQIPSDSNLTARLKYWAMGPRSKFSTAGWSKPGLATIALLRKFHRDRKM
ncbi:MAG: hypothetical protein KDN19_09340 [Verrucomicrobiae bacterium]|nr:hypothetical protein [Verrucomicrobiae bacterium]